MKISINNNPVLEFSEINFKFQRRFHIFVFYYYKFNG